TDLGVPKSDGYDSTLGYPVMTGNDFVENLLYYGVSAIALDNTGSSEEGNRACVSFVQRSQFADLDTRLRLFNENFSKKD
ncbi:MAG: hypothetical protein ACK5HT_13640, partial [Draconibacterium sp.]